MNNRRNLIVALGAGALAASLASFAKQQGKAWRVGFLSLRSRPPVLGSDQSGVFLQAMRDLDYIEGRNLTVEWRFADLKVERLPDLAQELVQLKVDVIVTASTPATSAAQKATSNIPIVMENSTDPVGAGFVKSLAHPGGNITGLSNIASELSPKLLEKLRDMVPKLSRVAVLANPDNTSHAGILKSVQVSALRTGVTILSFEARNAQGIENAFSQMVQKKAGAVIVARDPLFNQQARQFADLAARNRLPTIAGIREYVEAGVLMSYGPSLADSIRRVATYVDKILKGAKPGDIPVEQPTKFELFINGKTAKALGLTIPQSLLIMADKVIE
jgi:putative ABC transport system substrate-binding protein